VKSKNGVIFFAVNGLVRSVQEQNALKENDYITDTAYSTTQAGIANSSAVLLPPRVVVFSRDATIGRCAITTRPMAVSQHFIAWECTDRRMPEYLLYVLRSMAQELERVTMGATVKTLGMPDVRKLACPVPPIAEHLASPNQHHVVAHSELFVRAAAGRARDSAAGASPAWRQGIGGAR
jgi:type I restriction enzyme S subunit